MFLDKHTKLKHRCYSMCTLCETKFSDKLKLKYHMEIVHQLGTKLAQLYVCPECHYCHKNIEHLCEHLCSKHGKTLEHPCEQCAKVLPSSMMLKIHTVEEHEYIERKVSIFKCDMCDKSFSLKKYLEKHVEKFHSTNSHVTIACDKCDFTTNEMAKYR